jgi:hypothetical protein
MWKSIILSSVLLLCSGVLAHGQSSLQACLPDGVKLTDVVSIERGQNGKAARKLTVKQRLSQLKARCRKGKLVDARGREIYFFHLVGCWGNPPEGYQEILERQSTELKELKKRYTVIEMTCNPSGLLIQ